MQRQYHIWAARKKRSLIRWKWDVEKAREKNKTIKLLVTKLQCWWRGLRAKWLALCLLQITVEVLWDPGSNQKYYFNHGLGEAFWELPSMLQRWHGKSARMPDVPEWVLISRIFGQVSAVPEVNRTMAMTKRSGHKTEVLSTETLKKKYKTKVLECKKPVELTL